MMLELNPENKETKYYSFKCPSCEIKFIAFERKKNTCPICNSTLTSELEKDKFDFSSEILCVNPIIKKEDACKNYIDYKKRHHFVPQIFKNKETINTARLVFVPFYLTNFKDKVKTIFEYKKKDKKIYNVGLDSEIDIKDYYVNQSKIIKNGIVLDSGNLKFESVEKFNYSKYKSSLIELIDDSCSHEACGFVKSKATDFIKNNIVNCQEAKLKNEYHELFASNTKCVLFPFWVISFSYKKTCRAFLINGQSGGVYGTFPISKLKAALIGVLYFIIFSVIFAAGLIVARWFI